MSNRQILLFLLLFSYRVNPLSANIAESTIAANVVYVMATLHRETADVSRFNTAAFVGVVRLNDMELQRTKDATLVEQMRK